MCAAILTGAMCLSATPARALVFAPCSTLPIGMHAGPVAACDLNGDLNPDIVVLGGSQIGVRIGHGDGTFDAAIRSAATPGATFVTTADLNRDGKLDVVSAHFLSGIVSLLFGHGDGTFEPPIDYSVGTTAGGVAVRDFDGDGYLDFVSSNAGSVVFRRGNGWGAFYPEVRFPTECYGAMTSVAAGDVNGDGHLDVVAASTYGGAHAFLAGNGHGAFAAPVAVNDGYFGASVSLLADFNHDGLADLAMAGSDDEFAGCVAFGAASLGSASGLSATTLAIGASCGAASIATADLDLDGHLDVAVGNLGSIHTGTPGSLSLSRGLGTGAFGGFPGVSLCGTGYISAGDFNRDGWPDLVTSGGAWNQVYVHMNQTGPPMTGVEPPAGGHALSASVAPNPARGDVAVRFTLPRDAETRVRVLDAAGRLVRELASGPLGSGTHALAWDRRTQAGTLAAPGLYLLEVRSGGARASSSLLLLR